MNPLITDDLHWTAFQYAAEELSEPMVRRFEEQLADCQLAREALAEVVALIAAARSAETLPADDESQTVPALMPASLGDPARSSSWRQMSSWRQAAGWVALGAAACLVLTFAVSSRRAQNSSDQSDVPPIAQAPIVDEPLLAALFPESESGDEFADAEEASRMIAPLAVISGDDIAEDAAEFDELPALDDLSAPDWLLAAVAESAIAGGRE